MPIDSPEKGQTTAAPDGLAHVQSSSLNAQSLPHIPDYEVLRRIGGGSYGEVWLARNVLGELRAIKVVHRNSFEEDRPFQREFEGLQKFAPISRSHPSQLAILHVGRNEEGGYFYYAMELADNAGENPKSEIRDPKEIRSPKPETSDAAAPALRTSEFGLPSDFGLRNSDLYVPRTLKLDLKRHKRLLPAECVEIGVALTTALAHLHAHGLVHRDIKPSNIIFVGGVPKLADIGLVTDVDASRSFVGTEGFLPPEGPGTPQADLYSLGKVLYEMSTGRDRKDYPALPLDWDALDAAEQARLLELNEVLVKVCEADPRRRYQTAEQLREDLALLQSGESVKRRRAVEQRWTIAKKCGVAAAAVSMLLAVLPFVKLEAPRQNRSQPSHPNGNRSSRKNTPATEEASRLYQKGRFHFEKLTGEDFKKAIDYMNQAIQIDPEFAPAYATLFEISAWGQLNDPDASDGVEKFAKRLMEIDDTLPEARNASGYVKFLHMDWKGAEEEAKRAISLDPDFAAAHNFYGYYLTLQGRIGEGYAHMSRALELQPSSRISAVISGYPFYAAHDYDRAIAQFRTALDLDANFFFARWWVGRAYEAKGECAAAIAEFEKNALLAGEDRAQVKARYDALRDAFAREGERGYWAKRLQTGWFEPRGNTGSNSPYYLAELHARLGEKESALQWLEKAYQARDNIYFLKFDPYWDSLREEPRFKALLKSVGLEK